MFKLLTPGIQSKCKNRDDDGGGGDDDDK